MVLKSSELDELFSSLESRKKERCSSSPDGVKVNLDRWREELRHSLDRVEGEEKGLRGLGDAAKRKEEQIRRMEEEARQIQEDVRRLESQRAKAKVSRGQKQKGDQSERNTRASELRFFQEREGYKERMLLDMRSKLKDKNEGLEAKKKTLTDYCDYCRDFLGLDLLRTNRDSIILQLNNLVSGAIIICSFGLHIDTIPPPNFRIPRTPLASLSASFAPVASPGPRPTRSWRLRRTSERSTEGRNEALARCIIFLFVAPGQRIVWSQR